MELRNEFEFMNEGGSMKVFGRKGPVFDYIEN